MQFTNKLTKEDYNEFRKMTGADSNLVMLFFLPNWHGLCCTEIVEIDIR